MTDEKVNIEDDEPTKAEPPDDWAESGYARKAISWSSVTGSPMASGGTITFPAGTFSPTMSSAAKKPARPKTVKMPQETSRKVLVSFLDDDDKPVWAKKLGLQDMMLSYPDGVLEPGQLTLTLSLEDVYGNESSPGSGTSHS